MKLATRYSLLAFFVLFIFGFTAFDMLVPDKEFSENENRYLAKAPAFSVKALLKDYTQQYETYTNDQFVLRDQWISIKSVAESALGKQENNGVVFGKDNYMFEKLQTLNQRQLERNLTFVAEFGDKHRTTPTTLGIIPTSYQVLADKVPTGLNNINQAVVIAELYADLAGTGISTWDVQEALNPQEYPYLYYRTDHHWTTQAAYLAYQSFVTSKGMNPVALDSLLSHEVPGFLGTYYSKSKKFNAVSDTITYYDFPGVSITIDGEEKDGLYDLPQFDARDKYAAFLHNNNGVTVLRRDSASSASPTRILVLKDSYGNSFSPFLTHNYDEVYVVDLRYYSQLGELMAQTKFDDILVLYNFATFAQDTNIAKLKM